MKLLRATFPLPHQFGIQQAPVEVSPGGVLEPISAFARHHLLWARGMLQSRGAIRCLGSCSERTQQFEIRAQV
eukprot:6462210-Amphidinium_carterae.1